MKHNRKLIFSCLLLLIIFGGLVFLKQVQLGWKSRQERASIVEYQSKNGLPVSVREVEYRSMPIYLKATAIASKDNSFTCYFSKNKYRQLSVGQKVLFDDMVVEGRIIELSDNIDLESGMYSLSIDLKGSFVIDQQYYNIKILSDELDDIIYLPDEAIFLDGEESFVWTVSQGHAERQVIDIGIRNASGVEIKAGLQSGDLVVMEGFSTLSDGVLVDIVKKYNGGI